MKNRVLKRLGVILCALILLGLLGCGRAPREAPLGLCLPPVGESWSGSLMAFAKEAAMAWEGEVVAATAPEIPGGLISSAQELVELNPGIVVMYAYDEAEGAKAAEIFVKKKIPVILVGNAIDSEDYALLITADNQAIGEAAGEYLAGRMGGEGAILVLEGPQGLVTDERNLGFERALAAYPGIDIVASDNCGNIRDIAMAHVTLRMQEYPDITGIFAHSDEMALGAVDSLEAIYAQVEAVVTVGGGKSVIESLMKNHRYLKKAWGYSPRIAALAVEYAIGYLQGEDLPEDKQVLLPLDPLDSTNAGERYDESAAY